LDVIFKYAAVALLGTIILHIGYSSARPQGVAAARTTQNPAPLGPLDRYQGDTFKISKEAVPIPNTSFEMVEIERLSDQFHFNALAVFPYNLHKGMEVVPRVFAYQLSEAGQEGSGKIVYLDSPNPDQDISGWIHLLAQENPAYFILRF
jgi:hypothetical protein